MRRITLSECTMTISQLNVKTREKEKIAIGRDKSRFIARRRQRKRDGNVRGINLICFERYLLLSCFFSEFFSFHSLFCEVLLYARAHTRHTHTRLLIARLT